MDGFPLFLATSGPTKRRKHYVCLLFSQYCVCYFLNIVSNPNRRSPSKNQFRDYHAWNRIEKLMPQHCTNCLKLLKLYEKLPTCFQTLTFCRNLGFQKPWICPWIPHGSSMDFRGGRGSGRQKPRLDAKAESPGCLKAYFYVHACTCVVWWLAYRLV